MLKFKYFNNNLENDKMHEKVCLCGSLKYYQEILEIQNYLIEKNIFCQVPIIYRNNMMQMLHDLKHPEDILKTPRTDEEETIGVKSYMAIVGLSDVIYVVNPSGYVGRSTSVEIGAAWSLDKLIYSKEEILDASVRVFVEKTLTPDELIEEIRKK